ncbi:MAG: hypothetical protein FJ045_00185 [Crenarchaeota archaeon]|nr:hypothetical protein [Candidatus Altiarchaeales archaeon]MBM4400351.1 hypothetical protein [Thermoproteota archaeon]
MLRRIRKTRIEKEEIIADFIFLLLSFITTEIMLYIFDIHWNFYPGEQLIPPAKHIFTDTSIYLWGGLTGAIIGLFLIKLFLLGLKEEEKIWKKQKRK